MSYNFNNNMYPYNRASTPNPTPRSTFQPASNNTRKQPIVIVKNPRSSQVVIEQNGGKNSAKIYSGPQVEPPVSPNPIISFRHDRSNQPQPVTIVNNGPIITPPDSNHTDKIPTITSPAPPAITPPDAFNRLSLLSFVSTFEDEKSFNETDLEVLGLDLKCQEPLLPMLHSVLSDAPLLDHSRHPMPECYSKIQSGKPSDKLSLFTPQTLLFIFYTYPRDPLQNQAAAELQRREWQFDEENEEWRDPDNNIWSVDKWGEPEENQGN